MNRLFKSFGQVNRPPPGYVWECYVGAKTAYWLLHLVTAACGERETRRRGLSISCGEVYGVQGGVLSLDRFPPKTLQAHTSAPLLVSLKDNEAMIITHRVSCLDF
jgi:hypothetical protein